MNYRLASVGVTFVIMTLFIAIVGVSVVGSTVFAQQSQNTHFVADLSGKSARPPNLSTNATGNASFTVTNGGSTMLYSVNATKLNKATDVVLVFSTGGRASNVVLLRTGSAEGPTGLINGPLVQGNITSSSLVGPLKGKQISDLVKDMIDGNIYLWVSTVQVPLTIAGKVTPAS